MRSECVRIDDAIDPVQLGAATALLWSRNGMVLAGVGEALRVALDRPGGAADAQRRLAELAGPNALAGPDGQALAATGAVAFGALPFDRNEPGELIVPQVVVGSDRDGNRWMTATGVSIAEGRELVAAALTAGRRGASDRQATSYSLASAVAPEFWRDEVVAPTRDRIAAGELNKVVLARELVLRTDAPIDVTAALLRLVQSYGTSILFAVDGFMGASPELLVARSGDLVFAHPLAGTAPRSSDPAVDAALAAGLEASTKDQGEHRITIDWLLDTLLPFCSYVDAEPEPAIITLPNVHHLGTRVEGRLSTPAASVLELVAALHPTPAVGGDPQDLALSAIAAIEPGERGRYAGPTGWVDAAGNGEFAVAVRSATITGSEARIWAGVGVVADSDPEAELAETRAKFQAMLGALVRP